MRTCNECAYAQYDQQIIEYENREYHQKEEERLTRPKDKYPCRARDCKAEEWFEELEIEVFNLDRLCDNCPFEKVFNKLGEYEDNDFLTLILSKI